MQLYEPAIFEQCNVDIRRLCIYDEFFIHRGRILREAATGKVQKARDHRIWMAGLVGLIVKET
jgi:hypothetical protein